MMLLHPRHKQSSVFTSVYSYQVVLGIFTICTSVIWSEIILCPIFVVLLADTGQSSSHAVRWPTFIWSQAISDHKSRCNSQLSPSLCNKRLLLWRKKKTKEIITIISLWSSLMWNSAKSHRVHQAQFFCYVQKDNLFQVGIWKPHTSTTVVLSLNYYFLICRGFSI